MSEAHDDFAGEPVYGLPEELPAGETIYWQGQPERWAVATRIFHFRLLIAYFVLLAGWEIATGVRDGLAPGALAYGLFGLSLAAALVIGFVWWLAHQTAQETVYTITNERLVLRFGVALQLSLNLPFKQIVDAAMAVRPDGSGDIALSLAPSQRTSWFALWPHCRPWRFFGPTQPTLRCLPDVAQVAAILGERLHAAQPGTDPSTETAAEGREPMVEAFG